MPRTSRCGAAHRGACRLWPPKSDWVARSHVGCCCGAERICSCCAARGATAATSAVRACCTPSRSTLVAAARFRSQRPSRYGLEYNRLEDNSDLLSSLLW